MNEKDSSVFLTQKGKKGNRPNAYAVEAEEADQLGWARTSHVRLLLRKKEMREVNDTLELMKDEYHVRMDKCDQREAEFKRKQMDMRYEVMKFEKFIQENDAKRERAEAKARQEHRMLEYKAAELRKLEKELVQVMEEEAKLKEGSERLKRYEDYLKGCSFSDEINDLLTRFRTLRDANVDLTKLCEQRDTSYEKRRSDIQQYRQDKQNEVLVTSSLLNEKQIELEQMRGMVKREEHKAEEEGDRVKGVCRESGQVMLAINNLHSSRCKQTMRIRNSGTNDKELDKMAFLERCLHCLQVIGERIEVCTTLL
ncbi:unnamed protein product [Ascophyllum nodosum]